MLVLFHLPRYIYQFQEDPLGLLAALMGIGAGGGVFVAIVVGFVEGFIDGLRGDKETSPENRKG